MTAIKQITFFILLIGFACHAFAQSNQNLPALNKVNIGKYVTTGKVAINNCTIGYRTFGTLNADRSNTVLWPTWFGGTSEHLFTSNIISNSMDITGLYIIAVDALANGVSSSPSNNPTFPAISIRDMVNTQHQLLVNHLGIKHLKAVIGISMGGMQALEWSVAYPKFMDNVISIVGTPKQSAFDILVWQTQVDLITHSSAHQQDFGYKKAVDIFTMNATTPTELAMSVEPDKLQQHLAQTYPNMPKPGDYVASAKAMITHDIYKSINISPKIIRPFIKANLLMIIAEDDHLVNPLSSIELAKNIKAKLVMLKGNNGHRAPFIQTEDVFAAISAFLKTSHH